MTYNTKTECLKFLFETRTNEREIQLDSNIQFVAQFPENKDLNQLAILTMFDAKNKEDTLKIECKCRSIFFFEDGEKIGDINTFLKQHREEAYDAMSDVVNNALDALGKEKIQFPKINF